MPHPSPKVHPLTPEEIEEAYRVWALAFQNGSRQLDSWRRDVQSWPEGTDIAGISEGGRLQAVLVTINFRCYFGADLILPMGGIAAVSSLPASRGRGYAGACLAYSLGKMREAGQVISMLGPFNWGFYRGYGWEWVGMARHYSLPTSILKLVEETEDVREATEADHAAIRDAYARSARRYRGALIRTEAQWNDVLADTDSHFTSRYVYEGVGGIDGYLAYRGGDRENLGFREFVALTPTAQRAMLGLLRRHNMQYRNVSWKAPQDDPLWSELYHWDMETKLQPLLMGRVVDVQGALQAWKPEKAVKGSVRIAIRDEHAPWNEGTWEVACEGREIEARKTSGDPQVSLDIQAFSQAYFGSPTLAELRAAGRVSVLDEPGFNILCDLLAGPPCWMNDFF